MLPDLPAGLHWLNPVVGEATDRGQWDLLRVGPGGADVVASVRLTESGQAELSLRIPGNDLVQPPAMLPIAHAFEVAAEFGRKPAR
ncbi:hypothetical protein CKY51_07240 [Xanthomonas maliensis]|nr:hypothetical protein CKY51_07240 [Xanthomonas maliensis]